MPVHTYPFLREYVRIARAIGNERRLYILLLLLVHSYTGGEIAEKLSIHKSSISKHLHVLLRTGLIQSQRKGGSVVFAINPKIRQTLQEVVDLFPNRATLSY